MIVVEEEEIVAMIVAEEEEKKTKSRLIIVCFFSVAIPLDAPLHGVSPRRILPRPPLLHHFDWYMT